MSFPVTMILPLSRKRELYLNLVINKKYIVCLTRFQTLNRNSVEYPELTNCYEKARKKDMLLYCEILLGTHCLTMNQ